mmetsp:Transcript_97152/g.190807  ORF Transcript_97152/g.190807 Transcript_97152/m.190807 type:complete len:81 (+) Transcript_97152:285-527(+)
MHSNNEAGTVQNIRDMALCVKTFKQASGGESSVLLHTDGAQSLGKLLVDVHPHLRQKLKQLWLDQEFCFSYLHQHYDSKM